MGAIIGLVLALASYTILQTINPNLVKMQLPIKVKMVTPQWAAQKCPNTGIYEGEFNCGKDYKSTDKGKSGKTAPLKSGSCKGIHCPKGAKDTYACTHLTYDGTKPPECAHQKAAGACEMMKKAANGCLNCTWDSLKAAVDTPLLGTLSPAIALLYMKDQCLSSGTQLTMEYDDKKLKATITSNPIAINYNLTVKLTDEENQQTFDFSTMYAKEGNKAKTITFSLCDASVTSCHGPNKQKIEEFCKFLKNLPSDSSFFSSGL